MLANIETDIKVADRVWDSMQADEEMVERLNDLQRTVVTLHRHIVDQGDQPRQYNGFYEFRGLDRITPMRVTREDAIQRDMGGLLPDQSVFSRLANTMMRRPASMRTANAIHSPLPSSMRSGASTMDSRIDKSSPVTCLSQLYTCASVVNTMLRNKVQRWALGTRGYFETYEGRYVLWEDVATGAGGDQERLRVRFGSLKKLDRAVEKLDKCYYGDVSLLVDIARQRIVFVRIDDLHLCLKLVMSDSTVRVVRVTNRMRPFYDKFSTAGYRDLRLNLVIQNELTGQLGLDSHVVELQLVHMGFAELCTQDSHARFRSPPILPN